MSLNTILATAPLTTTNYILKATGTTIGNSLIWDNGTNVGIGNTNTSYTLDVSGTLRTTGALTIGSSSSFNGTISNTSGGYTASVELGYRLRNDANSANLGGFTRRSYWVGGSALDTQIFAETGYGIYLNVNGSQAGMAITSAGNVGIGTMSPATKLEVNDANGIPLRFGDISAAITGQTAGYIGMSDSAFSVRNGDLVLYPRTSAACNILLMGGDVLVNSTSTSSGAKFNVFYSDATHNGQVIRETSGNASVTYMIFNSNGTQTGSISRVASTAAVNYVTTSDYRLKEDLKEIKGLEKITQIKVYDFKWKDNEYRMDGVLAHELQEIVPFAVNGEKDELDKDGNIKAQGVDYSKLVPILIKGMQEQQIQIQNLQEQINILAK